MLQARKPRMSKTSRGPGSSARRGGTLTDTTPTPAMDEAASVVESTLGQTRVPGEGDDALWDEFIRICSDRRRLNLNATENQYETLSIIARLYRRHAPHWSYFLACKKIKRQRNAKSDFHP